MKEESSEFKDSIYFIFVPTSLNSFSLTTLDFIILRVYSPNSFRPERTIDFNWLAYSLLKLFKIVEKAASDNFVFAKNISCGIPYILNSWLVASIG